jgi:hypothetical protein
LKGKTYSSTFPNIVLKGKRGRNLKILTYGAQLRKIVQMANIPRTQDLICQGEKSHTALIIL